MEIVCRRRKKSKKEPWFGKSSCFACLMGYFPGSCSGVSIMFGLCHWNNSCFKTLKQISDLDSEAATRGVILKKIHKIHRKKPVSESPFE